MAEALDQSGGQVVKAHQRFPAWGKLFRGQTGHLSGEHSLLDHMTDVAACFLALAECAAIRRALETTAGRVLDAADLQRLAVLVFLHDVGKANAGFQAKRWVAVSQPVPPGWPAPAGHTHEALCIFSDKKLLTQLPVDEMDTWGSACLSLWRASISHHGRPVEESSQVDTKIWQSVISAGQVVYDPQSTLRAIGQCLRDRFGSAFEARPALPASPQFAHLFAGLVQLADWLGSDTRLFPYSVPGEDRNQLVWQRAREAVQRIGLDANVWRQC